AQSAAELTRRPGGHTGSPQSERGRVVSGISAMIRSLLKTIVIIPTAALLVALAIANRQPVTVSFDPFDSSDPDLAVTVPFYLVGFTVLIAGVVLGGIAAWLKQGKQRRIV